MQGIAVKDTERVREEGRHTVELKKVERRMNGSTLVYYFAFSTSESYINKEEGV